MIHLWGELAAPVIHFEPKAIQFLPAPLRTRTSLEFSIIAQGFRRYESPYQYFYFGLKIPMR